MQQVDFTGEVYVSQPFDLLDGIFKVERPNRAPMPGLNPNSTTEKTQM